MKDGGGRRKGHSEGQVLHGVFHVGACCGRHPPSPEMKPVGRLAGAGRNENGRTAKVPERCGHTAVRSEKDRASAVLPLQLKKVGADLVVCVIRS